MSTLPTQQSAASQTDSPGDLQAADRAGKDMSSPRLFFVGMALFMLALVVAGFWPTYFGRLLSGLGPSLEVPIAGLPWVIHLHAAIFLGWMGLLLTQATLIARDRTKAHMKLGRFGVGLGVVILVVGSLLVILVHQRFVAEGNMTWAQLPLAFVLGPGIQMVVFALLLTLGFAYRKRPEMHKRFMLFATAAILPAATARRMEYLLGTWSLEIVFAVLIGLIIAHDVYTERRMHPATLIGTAIVVVEVFLLA